MTDEELQEVSFKRANDYRQQIYIDFDDELKGLQFVTFGFHTKETKDFDKYNGFNFTVDTWDSPFVDSFWNSYNTTLLYGTRPYVLGEEIPEEIVLRLLPERLILKNQNVTSKIFGMPIQFED